MAISTTNRVIARAVLSIMWIILGADASVRAHAEADTRGFGAWGQDCHCHGGKTSIVNDPNGRYGKVYCATIDGRHSPSERAEVARLLNGNGRSVELKPGDTYYFGFSTMLDPFALGSGHNTIWQLHPYPGKVRWGVRANADGRHFELHQVIEGTMKRQVWQAKSEYELGTWYKFIIKIVSRTDKSGKVEIWLAEAGKQYVKQEMANGSTTWTGITGEKEGQYWKQGIYRADDVNGTSRNYFDNCRIATSFDEADPGDGNGSQAPSTKPEPTKISSPANSEALVAGQNYTFSGSGENLVWYYDIPMDGVKDTRIGEGTSVDFTIPQEAVDAGSIDIILNGSGGETTETYSVSGNDLTAIAPGLRSIMHARKSNVKFYDLRDRRVVPHPQKPSMGSGRVSARIMADQTGPKFFLQRRRQQRR